MNAVMELADDPASMNGMRAEAYVLPGGATHDRTQDPASHSTTTDCSSTKQYRGHETEHTAATGVVRSSFRLVAWMVPTRVLPHPHIPRDRHGKNVSGMLALVIALTLLGNIAYGSLERNNTVQPLPGPSYKALLQELVRTTNITGAQLQALESFSCEEVTPPSVQPAREETPPWGFPNYNTFFFAFSVISAIGYGNVAPVTAQGKIFTIAYCLIGIPICITSVSICAAEFLAFWEWLAISRMDQVRVAFGQYDTDHSGALGVNEFRSALADLGINLTDHEFEALVEHIDADRNRSLDLVEFKKVIALLGLPIGKVARAKVRVQVGVLVACLWMVFGSIVVHLIEGWTILDSLYFVVMSLTTVGFGDFVPATRGGVIFMVFYCVFGLGMVAVLVNAVSQFNTAVKNKAHQKAAEVVAHSQRRVLPASRVSRMRDKTRNTWSGP